MATVAELEARFRSTGADAIVRDAKSADTAIKNLEKSTKSMGERMANVGEKMVTRLTLPILGLGAVSFKAASDLNESITKTEAVFGGNAQKMIKWSEDAATAFGLSQGQALEYSATLGNLFKGIGVSTGVIDDWSQSLVQAAADLGSFNNIDPTQVLEDLRSGLVGEAEPLRKYGILLNESTVKQKAMEMGLADLNGELSESAKVQARYALINEQIGDAQGDFARTADGAANSMRTFRASLAGLAATFGQVLLPIGTRFIRFMTSLTQRFRSISPQAQRFVVIIAGIAAALGPALVALGKIPAILGAIRAGLLLTAGPWGLAIAAIGAFAFAFTRDIGGIRSFFGDEVLPRFQEHIDDFLTVFNRLRDEGATPLNAGIRALGSALEDLTGIENSAFFSNMANSADTAVTSLGLLVGAMRELISDEVGGRISEHVDDFQTVYKRLREEGVDPLEASVRALGSALEDLTGIENSAEFYRLAEVLGEIELFFRLALPEAFNVTKAAASLTFSGMRTFAGEMETFFRLTFMPTLRILKGEFDNIARFIRDVRDSWVGVHLVIGQTKDDIIRWIGEIAGALQPVIDLMIRAGLLERTAENLANVAGDKVGGLIDWATGGGSDSGGEAGGTGAGFGTTEEEGGAGAKVPMTPRQFREQPDFSGPEWKAWRPGTSSFPGTLRAEPGEIMGERVTTLPDVGQGQREAIAQFRSLGKAGADAAAAIAASQGSISRSMGDIANAVTANMTRSRTVVETTTRSLAQTAITSFQTLRSSGEAAVSGLQQRVASGFEAMRSQAVGSAAALASGVVGAINPLSSVGFGIGVSLGQNLAGGLLSQVGAVAAAAAALGAAADSGLTRSLGIASPSKVMLQRAAQIVDGLVFGINAGQGRANRAMSDLVTLPPMAMAGAGGGGRVVIEQHFDMRGSIVTQDAMATIRQAATEAAARAIPAFQRRDRATGARS